MTLRLLPRGNALFVEIDGQATPFLQFANKFAIDGVEFGLRAVRGRTGSYSVEIPTEQWKTTTPLARQTSMTALASALLQAGVSDEQVRYVDSRRDNANNTWKPACNIYIDTQPVQQGQAAPQMDVNAEIVHLTEVFMKQGGDLSTVPILPVPAMLVAWLRQQVGGSTTVTTVNADDTGEEDVEPNVAEDDTPF